MKAGRRMDEKWLFNLAERVVSFCGYNWFFFWVYLGFCNLYLVNSYRIGIGILTDRIRRIAY